MGNEQEGAFACASEAGYQKGLTKREYFAVNIATGLSVKAIAGSHNTIQMMENEIPLLAVRIADALLAALESKSE